MNKSEEQLINDFLDGTLNSDGQSRFDELYRRDANFAREADFYARQKQLLGADKPGGIDVSEAVRERLRTRQPATFRGRENIGLRRFFNVAAMVLMALVLGSVLWVIVKPGSIDREPVSSVALEGSRTDVRQISPAAPLSGGPVVTSVSKSDSGEHRGMYNYNFTFRTREIAKAERVFSQILYDNRLLQNVYVDRSTANALYSIECGKDELADIVERLDVLWGYVNEGKLDFCDYSRSICFEVDDIRHDQAKSIVKSENSDQKLAIARTAAAMNNLPAVPSINTGHTGNPSGLLSLRPVLAGDEPDTHKRREEPRDISLTFEFILTD
jgi:hypothetical protein